MTTLGRSQTSIEGSLYELVARGAKDTYFIQDDKTATNVMDWKYQRHPATLPEFRYTVPINPPKFGQRCEFEMDLPGDVLLDATLVIELPTWLPPEFIAQNVSQPTYVAGSPYDIVYGYVSGIAYFLFERIEIYQDKILLQEVSGDTLYAAALSKGSWNQAFLTQNLTGIHDGSNISIQRNATPGLLELPLPMIGCSFPGDKGFPICALKEQTFRIRVTLRPLERLVEASNGELNPEPWGKIFTQGTMEALALDRELIKQPTITLRTKQLYLLNDARKKLAEETIEVPYIRYFDNVYTIGENDYAPINKNVTPFITRFLYANYIVERILSYFRNSKVLETNQLWNFTNTASTDGNFYTSLELIIAGQSREGAWGPDVFEQLVQWAKEERTCSQPIAIMNWSRGWRIEDTPPAIREPTGGINFTTADRPMLSIGLSPIEIWTKTIKGASITVQQSQITSCCESWALYKIENGRGRLAYAN